MKLLQLKHITSIFICLIITDLTNRELQAQVSSVEFEQVPIEINGEAYRGYIAITQDQAGYMWISTGEGLIRYDGYKSILYAHNPIDSTSIGHNAIEALHIDHEGALWAGTVLGVSRYNRNCDCFTNYTFQPNNNFHPRTGGIRTITEDIDHNIWVGMHAGGLFKYDRVKDVFIPYLDDPNNPNSLTKDYVYIIMADRTGHIWIGTGNPFLRNAGLMVGGGLVRFNPTTGKCKRFVHDPANPNSLIDNRVTALLEDHDGHIWVGTDQNGLHRYQPDKENFT